MKKHEKIDAKSMQILNVKKKASEHGKTWIWEGLGLNLGGVWDALGRLLVALGRFLLIFLTSQMMFFSTMGPGDFRKRPGEFRKRPGFEGFGRFGVGFGHILDPFGKNVALLWQSL